MKDTTFFLIVGFLSGVSLACGILGLHYSKRKEEKGKHGYSATFNDLYEDNAPKEDNTRYPTERELCEEYARDCGWSGDYPY